MIRYALKCAEGHSFESWFQSAEAYDKLAAAGLVTCAVCGCDSVEKAIMAPRVRPARSAATAPVEAVSDVPAETAAPVPASQEAASAPVLSTPSNDAERALIELRKQVEANSDYVGGKFADEARAMHLGDTPARAIHGEAKPEEARELIEEGVPVMPLPFLPNRKTN